MSDSQANVQPLALVERNSRLAEEEQGLPSTKKPLVLDKKDWYMRDEWFVTHVLVEGDSEKYACYKDWGASCAPKACFQSALRKRRSVWRRSLSDAMGGIEELNKTMKDKDSLGKLLEHFQDAETPSNNNTIPQEVIVKCRKHLLTPFDDIVVSAVDRALQKVSMSLK